MRGQTFEQPQPMSGGTPWLRLQADLNGDRRFERLSLAWDNAGVAVYNPAGNVVAYYSRRAVMRFAIEDVVGGCYLAVTTREGESTLAGFTFPLVAALREALPAMERWVSEGASEGANAAGAGRAGKQGEDGSHGENGEREAHGAHGGYGAHGARLESDGVARADEAAPRVCERCGRTLRLGGRSKCLTCSNKVSMLRRLLQYCAPYRRMLAISGVLMLASVLVELLPPLVMKVIIDTLNASGSGTSYLLWLVAGLGGIYVVTTVMQVFRSYLGNVVGSRMSGDIRKDMFQSLMKLSMKYYDRRQVSQFIGRINNDTEELKEFLTNGIIQFVSQLMLAAATLVMLLSLSWQLTMLILVPLPFFIVGYLWIWPRARSLWYGQWQASMKLQNKIGEALQGIRVIKAFAQEQAEKERVNRANAELVRRTVSISNIWLSVNPIFGLATAMSGIGIWYIGGKQALAGTMTVGTLIAFSTYLSQFFGPVTWLGSSVNWINRLIGSAERVFETMDAPIDVPDKPGATVIAKPAGEIRFHGVRYGYEQAYPVLKGLDFTIRPGEMVGVVGHSGAGKTTLVNLICRFYDPDEGSITLDGMDLRDIQQVSLRKNIGVVLQETFLFDGTIAQNIAYGMPDASVEQLIGAAKTANAHDFICRMPEGYDTMVGERGHRLSGGEKQRIAIARAVLLDPRILILDEATASVDSETELLIRQALDRLVAGRTTIAIAHRLSTLKGADRLIVLEQGKLAEAGTHDELYARRGAYYRLVESQQGMADKPLEVG